MSNHSQTRPKFQAYPGAQVRTHTDFNQQAYTPAYGYAQPHVSVQSNPNHDLSKTIPQPNMYPPAGGIAAQQHHQAAMGGQVPPQSTMVRQQQQLNQNTMSVIQPYRPMPRNMTQNMGRNPMAHMINHGNQQANSQYASVVQMVAPQNSIGVTPQQMLYGTQTMFNQFPNQFIRQPQLYLQGNSFYPPQQPAQMNHFYTAPPLQPYPMQNHPMPPQMPTQPTLPLQPTQKKASKAIPILDPKTGMSIFEGSNENENAEPLVVKEQVMMQQESEEENICAQFAKQVALASKSTVDDNRIIDSHHTVAICPPKIEPARIEAENCDYGDIESPGELADVESLAESEFVETRISCTELPVVFHRNDLNPKSINECAYTAEPSLVVQNAQFNSQELQETKVYAAPVVYSDSYTETPEQTQVQPVVVPEYDSQVPEMPVEEEPGAIEMTPEQEVCVPVQEAVQTPIAAESVVVESSEIVQTPTIPEKISNEAKKNKAKKKKDYNKKGESKEGGEMDAFLDTREESTPTLPTVLPTTPVPTPVERVPSPVPILDTQILSSIPLPGEPVDNLLQQNDVSPSEPTSETSSVSPVAEGEDKENAPEEDGTPKVVLKYSYKEDQWSPLNPEGKKQYDRSFLLQMQGEPLSLCKPNNLPNLDVIKDKAQLQRLNEVNNRVVPPIMPQIRTYNDPFMPNYARGGAPRMPQPPVRRSQNRGGVCDNKPRKVISFTSSLTQNVKLHESENAWKPMYKVEISLPEDELEKEKLKRSVQGVLNKLTPQKFDALLAQLKSLFIETEQKLNIVIDLIFEKAIDEPNFSVPYANLCKSMAMIKVPLTGCPGQEVQFRKLLLTKCQKEFEKDRNEEQKHEEKLKALEAAPAEKKKELQLEFDEEEKKLRYRQLGNIRFIGELFKLNMLTENIMHECIKKLLIQGDEESLECLCKLLKTIGKELDDSNKGKSSRDLDQCFAKMSKIVEKRLTSSRVRFMLQDVIDLKRGNWVPRRDENNPKTIDQIHQEAEREAREQQQVLQNMSSYPPKRPPDDRDRRKNSGRLQTEDGWTSSTKTTKGSYSSIDPTKLKLSKAEELETVRLGPGGRGLSSWGKGSSGGNRANAEPEKSSYSNRFSALTESQIASNFEGRRGSQRSAASSRESSRGRNNQMPPPVRKTPSTSKERENLLETVKGLAAARANESKAQEPAKVADVHLNGKAPESEELGLKGPEYSESDIEKKTKALIDEFLHNCDVEEAVKCVLELASPNTIHMVIIAAINQVLERSTPARHSLGNLLFILLQRGIVTFDQYNKGFAGVLELVEDYAVDIPHIFTYMGEILEPLIIENKYPLSVLKDVLGPCIPSQTAAKIVSAVLHIAAKRKGTIILGEWWRNCGLEWTDFLEANYCSDFVQKNALEFTLSTHKVQPSIELSMDEIQEKLLELLGKNTENEEIFNWIDSNITDSSNPNFIRALVTAVNQSVIVDTDKLDQETLKTRAPLLVRYIAHHDLQLQALYAIQNLMNKLSQPHGLLHQIFDTLYDEDVINEEAFRSWETSEDPDETEGKGVALLSTKNFFTWLNHEEISSTNDANN